MFELQSYLPYLLNRVGVAVSESFSVDLAADGLSVSMWRVLAVIWHDGPLRVGALAERTSIEVSTLSRLLSTLERRGLLVRQRAQNDARATNVVLTTRGRALTERLISPAQALESRLIGDLEPGQVAQLRALLDRLYANMCKRERATLAEHESFR